MPDTLTAPTCLKGCLFINGTCPAGRPLPEPAPGVEKAAAAMEQAIGEARGA